MADLPKPTAKTRRSEPTLVVGSESQARASRQNGARSRGPRSAAGKARSARNAVTHGLRSRRLVLLDDENAAEFRAFAAALQAELAPEGRLQADLVGRIVMAAWRARRADKLEAGLLGAYLTADPADPDPRATFGERVDPRQLRPARVRHAGPLPRLGAGRMVPFAGSAEAAPGRGAGPVREPAVWPSGRPPRGPNEPEKARPNKALARSPRAERRFARGRGSRSSASCRSVAWPVPVLGCHQGPVRLGLEGAMRVCVLHAARDLRLEDRPEAALGADQVRVRFGAGGICGSDLHYYYEGRVGDFAVREPLILGHEVAGEVIETGRDVTRVKVGRSGRGQPEPALLAMPRLPGRADQPLPAHDFLWQRRGLSPHPGRVPGAAGVLREPMPRGAETLPYGIAALAEPLAVCLHAVRRAGALLGQNVLITGCGPIGALTCIAARYAGAARITVTDIAPEPLAVAREGRRRRDDRRAGRARPDRGLSGRQRLVRYRLRGVRQPEGADHLPRLRASGRPDRAARHAAGG